MIRSYRTFWLLATTSLFIILFIFISKCNEQVIQIFDPPTVREQYISALEKIAEYDSLKLNSWKTSEVLALNDSVQVLLPYTAKFITIPTDPFAAGYLIDVEHGEAINISFNDTAWQHLFLDIWQITEDSIRHACSVYEPHNFQDSLQFIPKVSGTFLVRILASYELSGVFDMAIWKKPILAFPVEGGANRDIGSYFGDPRDGGRRKHMGIDIFAKKGTPLVAAAKGRVTSVRDRGLGGKQVWIHTDDMDARLYYAHLDSQYVSRGSFVGIGDTIGTVGNTGNARTTPPHLHFAIYLPYFGAIDPLPFVKKYPDPPYSTAQLSMEEQRGTIHYKKVNYRSGPGSKNSIIKVLSHRQSVKILGRSQDWYHVRFEDRSAGFIYTSSIISESLAQSDLTGS